DGPPVDDPPVLAMAESDTAPVPLAAVVVVASGGAAENTDLFAIDVAGDGVATEPRPLHVRHDDAANSPTLIRTPVLVSARAPSRVLWHEDDCAVPYGGCLEKVWSRPLDGRFGDPVLVAAGDIPGRVCYVGAYGSASAVRDRLGRDVATLRKLYVCFSGPTGEIFGVVIVPADDPLSTAIAGSAIEDGSEPLSNVALAAGRDSVFAAWWLRRFGDPGADAIVASPLGGGEGRQPVTLAVARNESPIDPLCNVTNLGCFRVSPSVAPPAIAAIGDAFFVVWVTAPAEPAPPVPTEVHAAIVDPNGSVVVTALVATGLTGVWRPAVVQTHGTMVVAWIASADGQSGQVQAVTVGADGNPRSQVTRLADDARGGSLVPTSDRLLAAFSETAPCLAESLVHRRCAGPTIGARVARSTGTPPSAPNLRPLRRPSRKAHRASQPSISPPRHGQSDALRG